MTIHVLAIAAALAALQLPARDTPRPPAKGTAVIKGFVVDAQTGAPLRRATVRVSGAGVAQQAVSTDAEGRFEIRELPAGKLFVGASGSGYLQSSYGQRGPNTPPTPLELLDGQQVEKVRIALTRGGVISGRVFDEFGEPASGVQVQAMQYRYQGGARQLVPMFGQGGPPRTDDLGGFRLYGLQPGQYYVSARPMNDFMPAASPDGTGAVPTYFPNASDAAGAQRLTVVAGKEVAGTNIILVTGRLSRIRGRAVMSSGEPFSGAYVNAQGAGGMGIGPMLGGAVRADGTFEINGVSAGQYLITVRPAQRGPRDTSNDEVGRAHVTVTGDDIDNVMLVGSHGATVRGRLVTDEGVPMPTPPNRVTILLSPGPEEFGGNGSRTFDIKEDYSFEMKGLFGRGRLSAMTITVPGDVLSGAGATWSPKTVFWRGQDVTDKLLDLDPGQVLDGFEIVFSRKWAEVSGTVVDERNQPAPTAAIVLFPAEESRWIPGSRYVRVTRSDAEGKYRAQGLLAGDYLIATVPSIEPGQQQDPEFLRSLVDRATRVSVDDGETKVQNLTFSKQ